MAAKAQYLGTGRRKKSVARVRLVPGKGAFIVNKRDLEEIPDNVIADLDIHPVKRIEEVLTLALQNEPSGMQVVTAK